MNFLTTKVIDEGAGKCLGMRRVLPEFLQKGLRNFCLKNFSHRDHEDLVLMWPPEKGLPEFFCKRWAPFFKSKIVERHFYPEFQWFCLVFPGFCPDFRQIKIPVKLRFARQIILFLD